MFAVEMNNVSFCYPDGTGAISDITLALRPNRRLALLGANGSGKTTLLTHLNGLHLPQTGTVSLWGIPVTPGNLSVIRRKVGILFDNPDNQLFSTTVAEDVAFGPFNMGCSDEEMKTRTEKALREMGITDLSDRSPCNLSWGQKKKAAIAGLLSMDIDLFVMDEPFSGLDPVAVDDFLVLLDTLYQKGKTLVISTHNVDLAYEWADEIGVISAGRLMAFGGIELLRDESLLKAAGLRPPVLARIFKEMEEQPRNFRQAAQLIQNMAGFRKSSKGEEV